MEDKGQAPLTNEVRKDTNWFLKFMPVFFSLPKGQLIAQLGWMPALEDWVLGGALESILLTCPWAILT